jgi:hypothetical protein
VVKVKNILNIEAGLVMIALALAICSEVNDFKSILIILIDFSKERWGVSGIGYGCQWSVEKVFFY